MSEPPFLPRFPQPFIESLLRLLDLCNILRLLSVDKREKNGRKWLLNQHFVIAHVPTGQDAMAFAKKYPNALTNVSLKTPIQFVLLQKVSFINMLTTLYNDDFHLRSGSILQNLTHVHLYGLAKRTFTSEEWPSQITHLSFGHQFNHSIETVSLPTKLEYLGFGSGYRHPIEHLNLPQTLEMLVVGTGGGLSQSMSIGSSDKVPWNSKLGLPVPPNLKIALVNSVKHLGQYNRNFTRLEKYKTGTFTLIDISKCKLG